MVTRNEFLEHATVLGRHSYGTPRAQVEAELAAGRDVAFDIDWQGHRQLRAALPGDVVGVFILPPSLTALESRLHGRGDEADAEIARRMGRARDEISHWAEFHHVMVNAVFDDALSELRAILHAARSSTPRQHGLPTFIASLIT
jgi:guanylate kinase